MSAFDPERTRIASAWVFLAQSRRDLNRRSRMMLMHNVPASVNFAEPHCQSKIQRLAPTISANRHAVSYCCSKRDFHSRSDFDVSEIKTNGFFCERKESVPSRNILINTSRLKWRRHIEHQNVGIVILTNCGTILIAYP